MIAATLIGYGEAGQAFDGAGNWRAFDVRPDRSKAASLDVALAGAELVVSVVTADQALAAAEATARHIMPGTVFCDMNSVAPETKRAAAAVIEAAGGRYADVAVLAPVNPAGLAVPLLLAGKAAEEAEVLLRAAGFTNIRVIGHEVGRASATKMIRSVMVKGVEALTAEMMLAAEAAGVVDEVLASLDASEKTLPWRARADYNIERMATHGSRRAAEMEESVKTLPGLGIEPVMTAGTVRRQREMAGNALERTTG